MDINYCIGLIIFLGILFFISGLIALNWSVRKGHFMNFEQQAKVIFTPEEPEGEWTDHFPKK